MKLPICRFNDPCLRKRAKPIQEISPEIVSLAYQMVETMLAAHGVGLAATQVGHLVRLFVLRDEWMDEKGDYVYGAPEVILNPSLSNPSEEQEEALEGCLSLPGLQVEVVRPQSIRFRYQNLEGGWIEEEAKGHRARVIMHENDHLNGVLMIDRLSKGQRKEIEPQLIAIKRKR